MPEEEPAADRPAYKLSAGFSVGLICLGLGNLKYKLEIDLYNRSFKMYYMSFLLTQEGPNVNVHLTGHPATIALGLMYLRTGNKAIARELALPETITLLEAIRPDLAQVPLIVRDYMKASLKWGEDDDIIVTEPENNYWDEIVDRETIAQVFVYAITGACFALALKYVSTGSVENDRVLSLLTDYINIFLPDNPRRTHQRVCEYAGLNVSSLCSDMLLISMALVMTSYGDMSTIQMARLFRMKEQMASWVRSPRKHHEQCEAHRALALMFLGKGRYAFKRDNLSIALLIISFYPIINHNVADNRLYHQPLRFMWVRAVEPRLLVPNEPIICHAPFLLPSLDDLSAIEVGGASLETVRFDLTKEDRRKELESALNQGYGRLQLSTTGMLVYFALKWCILIRLRLLYLQ
uniref:Anaphase-promoting complex subunit 1 n=1 Tax=Heterorhabditis bacteriophora TaxID=37862 RepID=A0A1I7WVU8_HETBA